MAVAMLVNQIRFLTNVSIKVYEDAAPGFVCLNNVYVECLLAEKWTRVPAYR